MPYDPDDVPHDPARPVSQTGPEHEKTDRFALSVRRDDTAGHMPMLAVFDPKSDPLFEQEMQWEATDDAFMTSHM